LTIDKRKRFCIVLCILIFKSFLNELDLQMGQAKVKVDINYIAMKLKMASSTVSKALNDRPDVSEATKEKVRKFARKLNYTPDRFAQAMRLKKSGLIGVIMHEMKHEFFVEIARSVTREAQQNGYQAIFASSEGDPENESAIIEDCSRRYIDGLIIIPCIGGDLSHLRNLDVKENPFVIVDNYVPGINAPFVGTDFEEGGYIATKHLLESGHKNIAFILGQKELPSTSERLAGYAKALKEAGVPLKKQYVRYGKYSSESGQENTKNILKTSPEITAVLCANTDLSEGAAKAITAIGRKIPDDISLMDFGGIHFTAVNQKNETIGQTAAQTIFRLINGEKITDKIIIKPEIADRDSIKNLICL